ncbi:TRAP transporter small permease [Marivita sp. S0852]|uniref:TRAP transporter small permease n=1 Tax=Marivita sp. S0852 TaxID=3373893 RepID=UPI0039829B07
MHSFFDRLARVFARLGGFVLASLIVLTCLSIAGRLLNTMLHGDFMQSTMPGFAEMLLNWGIGPINGDFELVESGMAFAIFAFLPLCQLNGAHASVDIFTSRLPLRANRVLRAVIEVVFAATLVLIAWQLFLGMESKRSSAQTTFLLEYPVWWAYAVSLVAAVVAAAVSIYVAVMRVAESVTGERILPAEMEADH